MPSVSGVKRGLEEAAEEDATKRHRHVDGEEHLEIKSRQRQRETLENIHYAKQRVISVEDRELTTEDPLELDEISGEIFLDSAGDSQVSAKHNLDEVSGAFDKEIEQNILPEVWHYACGIGLALYLVLVFIFTVCREALHDFAVAQPFSTTALGPAPDRPDVVPLWSYADIVWDSDVYDRAVAMLAAAVFLSASVQTLAQLMGVARRKQRCGLYVVLLTNLISTHAHIAMAAGASPVFLNCFGRKSHWIRWAQWAGTIVLLMVTTHALDCPNREELVRSTLYQTVSILTGLASASLCGGFRFGGEQECHLNPSSQNFWLSIVLLLISTACYGNIFIVAHRALRRNRSVVGPSQSVSRLLYLTCCGTWTLYVLIYFAGAVTAMVTPAGATPWFTDRMENVCFTIADVFAKSIYIGVLGNAHTAALSPEAMERLQEKLDMKLKANQAQRHFLRYVFHEVRVPLNTIRLGIDSVQRATNLDEDCQFALSCMDEAASNMSGTLNDVLSFQKIEEGKLEMHFKPFHLGEMVHQCEMAFQASLLSKSLRLEVNIADDVDRRVIGDHFRLKQVLNNLVSNAIKFSGDGSTIELNVTRLPKDSFYSSTGGGDRKSRRTKAPTIRFSITDHGIGIHPSDQQKLFRPFSQVRPGDLQMGRGSGLGLSISHRIVQLHGGSIGVESAPGQGSTFFFDVPLSTWKSGEQESSSFEGQFVHPSSSSLGDAAANHAEKHLDNGATVPGSSVAQEGCQWALIVDDVRSNRILVQKAVQRLGFQCDYAEDGEQAVQRAREKHYAVILMDNLMPKMTGVEACQWIRQNERTNRETKAKTIIFGLTGNALSEDIASFSNAGCDEVLTKPLSVTKLKTALQHYGFKLADAS